jgi:TonB family protein
MTGVKLGVLLFIVASCGFSSRASADQTSKPEANPSPDGYVTCSGRGNNGSTPTFLNLCGKLPAGDLVCGQKVSVIQRHGAFLEIKLPDGVSRYVAATAISKRLQNFVPFDVDSGIVDVGLPDCPIPIPPEQKQLARPRAYYSPDPEYSEQARKKKISGTVAMLVTVGTDGIVRDVKLEKKLGYGLDEKALDAIHRWKFQPAYKDGQPVEAQVQVSMSFRLY